VREPGKTIKMPPACKIVMAESRLLSFSPHKSQDTERNCVYSLAAARIQRATRFSPTIFNEGRGLVQNKNNQIQILANSN